MVNPGSPMTTAVPSTALVTIQPAFTDPERLALAGFLAGYRGLTREAYALDLHQFTTWSRASSLPLFAVRRADIESFARELELKGRARATVTRRLCTIAGFCKYAVEEDFLEDSPAAHVRRQRPRDPLGRLTMLKLPGDEFVTIELGHDPAQGEVSFGAGLRHIVINVESLDATISELAARGIGAEAPVSPDGSEDFRTTCLIDPDGNRIELVQWPAGHSDGITAADWAQ